MADQFLERLPYYLYGEIDGLRRVLYTINSAIDPNQAFLEVRVLGQWSFRARLRPVAALPAYTVSSDGQYMTADVIGVIPVQDGTAVILGDVLLLDSPATTSDVHNGLWVVENVGDAFSQKWQLRRSQLADEINEITPGSIWYVTEGATGAGLYWNCTNTGDVTPGVTPITFQQFFASVVGYCTPSAAGIVNPMGSTPGMLTTDGVTPGGIWATGLVVDDTTSLVDFVVPGTVTATGNPIWNTGTGDFTIGGTLYLEDNNVWFGATAGNIQIKQTTPAVDVTPSDIRVKGQSGGQQSALPVAPRGGYAYFEGGTGGAASGAGGNSGPGGNVQLRGGDAGAASGAVGNVGGHAIIGGGQGIGPFVGGNVYVDGGYGAGGNGRVYIGYEYTSFVVFGNPTDNPTYEFLGSGASNFYGPVVVDNVFTQTGGGNFIIDGQLYLHNNNVEFNANAGNCSIYQAAPGYDTIGTYMQLRAQPGGVQSAGAAGAQGGYTIVQGGTGGASSGALGTGGPGGDATFKGGAAGAANGGTGGQGGDTYILGGLSTGAVTGGKLYLAAGGTGSGTNGSMFVGYTDTAIITFGNITDNPPYNFVGSGHFTVTGPVYFEANFVQYTDIGADVNVAHKQADDDLAGNNTYYTAQEGGDQVAAGFGGDGGYFYLTGGAGGIAHGGGSGKGGKGGRVYITGGAGGDAVANLSGAGGFVYIAGGSAGDRTGGTGAVGGDVHIDGGYGYGTYRGGRVYIDAGTSEAAVTDASVYIGTTKAETVEIGNTTDGTLIKLKTPTTAEGTLQVDGNIGFYGTSPAAQPTITGSKGGNAALADLLTKLAALGLIVDSTT